MYGNRSLGKMLTAIQVYHAPCTIQNGIWHAKWERDIEGKARVIDEIGVYTGWNEAAPPGDYDEIVRRLNLSKKRFLDQESRTPEEWGMWEKVWPF
jgi:hypothetical protein